MSEDQELTLEEVNLRGFRRSEETLRVVLADKRRIEFERFIRTAIKNAKNFKELSFLPCYKCFSNFFKADKCDMSEPMDSFQYLNYEGIEFVKETTKLSSKLGLKETVIRRVDFKFRCSATLYHTHRICVAMNVESLTPEMQGLLKERLTDESTLPGTSGI